MSAAFQPGDRVRQKGTYREMVVERYDDAGRVWCSWWTGEATVATTFLQADLEKIPLPPS